MPASAAYTPMAKVVPTPNAARYPRATPVLGSNVTGGMGVEVAVAVVRSRIVEMQTTCLNRSPRPH